MLSEDYDKTRKVIALSRWSHTSHCRPLLPAVPLSKPTNLVLRTAVRV